MDSKRPEDNDDRVLGDTPEDVAVLFSWANLQGAKYRDFSASRRAYRAQMRQRAAETQRESEMHAKAEAEAAAAAAEKAAREAEETARFHETAARRAAEEQRRYDLEVEEQARLRALQHAEELGRRAAAERMEAARRAEAVAAAEAAARREAREVAEAHASAQRQAARYAESESMRKALAGPQPEPVVPGVMSDPYTNEEPSTPPVREFRQPGVPDEEMRASRLPKMRDGRPIVPQPEESAAVRAEHEYWERTNRQSEHLTESRAGIAAAENPGGPINYYYEPDSQEKIAAVDQYAQYAPYAGAGVPEERPLEERYAPPVPSAAPATHQRRPQELNLQEDSDIHAAGEGSVPAWISSQTEAQREAELRFRPQPPVADTLQQSRERVAARWYALKGVLEKEPQTPPTTESGKVRHHVAHHAHSKVPMAAIFSIAGGVGKTSIVATLGRALSLQGEQVLLVDTTLHGLLPFYFGASELRPGTVKTFAPPSGSKGEPVALVNLDVSEKSGDTAAQEWLSEELTRSSQDAHRMLLDVSAAAPWVMRGTARMNAQIIVPVAPDMNSVISLGAVEKFFTGMSDAEGQPLQPFYLLNQFDASLPLHLDVREVMRQKLGDRLLPFVVRRSPAVAEALAEGMTVMDYAPEAPVAGDYTNLASWLRTQSAPASAGHKNVRWSER